MNFKALAIKGVIGLVGVGGASIGIHQGIKALNKEEKKTISSKLEKNKYKLLGNGAEDSQIWKTILESYKTVTSKKDNLKFKGFDGNKPNNSQKEAVDILKEHCQEILSKKDSDRDSDADFEKAKKWCVKPITVSALLKEQGFVALSTEANISAEEKEKWEIKIKAYKRATSEVQKIANLTLSSEVNKTIDKDYTDIKEKCKTISVIENHTETYEDNLKAFELWCANK